PPAEHPNRVPLQAAEEGTAFQPPRGRAGDKLRQPPPRQPDVLVEVRLHDRPLARGKKLLDGRLLRADERGEEAALGEDLMRHIWCGSGSSARAAGSRAGRPAPPARRSPSCS